MLKTHYEFQLERPKEISWDNYLNISMREYLDLLENHPNDENTFQQFFERNPSYIPGAFEIFGHSGFYPYMDTLITQPKIGNVYQRIPDFLWLAQDSLTFCPVFIEIESPGKKMFTKSETVSADFNQSINQIREWRFILKDPVNVQAFYNFFDIPDDIKKKEFKPQFALIYGRRQEYDDSQRLKGLRAEYQESNLAIFSYDRLKPLSDSKQFTCTFVKETKYHIKTIPPTFRYRPDRADVLCHYQDFFESIDQMKNTSKERKAFLKSRYEYWKNFGEQGTHGIVSTEGE